METIIEKNIKSLVPRNIGELGFKEIKDSETIGSS